MLVRRATRKQEEQEQEQGNTDTSSSSSSSASAEQKSQMMIVSYDRRTLNQTGTGHFSPIGGYCEAVRAFLLLTPLSLSLSD